MNIVRKSQDEKALNLPTKRKVNLAKKESHRQSIVTLVVGGLIIAAIGFSVAKFAVADQFARLNEAESAYNIVHQQNEEIEEKLESYPEVEQEYHTYSRKWMTDGETAVKVDRQDVLNLIEDHMMSCGTVNAFTIDEDVVLVNMSGMNLQQISVMFSDLQNQDIVDSAKLTIASTTNASDEVLNFSVTINLYTGEEEEES